MWGAQLGVEGERPSPPTPPLPLSSHSQNMAFRTLLVSCSCRHGCGEGVGGDSWGQPLPLLLQLTLHLPFLSLPQAGPHPLLLWGAGAGRWWPMRRGSGENLSRASPPPFPPRSLHRLWKELGDGSWARGGGGALLAGESLGIPLWNELGVRAEGILAPAPSLSLPKETSGHSLVKNLPVVSLKLAGQSCLCPSALC